MFSNGFGKSLYDLYCQIKGLPLFWQIVLLCALMVFVTIGATWVSADVLANQYKTTLAQKFGIGVEVAHGMFVDSLHRTLIVSMVLGLVATLIASFVFVPMILQPLKAMSAQADKVASGDFSVRVDLGNVPDSCEIHALGGAFNRMAGQLEVQQKERVRIMADLSHDLITPLTNLKGYFEAINEGVVVTSPPVFTMLSGEVARLIRLVSDLNQLNLTESAKTQFQPQKMDTASLFQSGAEFIGFELAQKKVEVQSRIAPGAESFVADHDMISRVLRNLLQNAVQHARERSTITLAASVEGPTILLSCSNAGDPIDPKHLPLIFDRFFRGDPTRSRSGGAGLGLAIAKDLVEAHQGTIGARSGTEGTTIFLKLPIVANS